MTPRFNVSIFGVGLNEVPNLALPVVQSDVNIGEALQDFVNLAKVSVVLGTHAAASLASYKKLPSGPKPEIAESI